MEWKGMEGDDDVVDDHLFVMSSLTTTWALARSLQSHLIYSESHSLSFLLDKIPPVWLCVCVFIFSFNF